MHSNWIWTAQYDDTDEPGRFVLFRRCFNLDVIPSQCEVQVSADTRYRLFVNGHRASFGPCKSYPTRWYYESVDIGPFLVKGQNVIAAKVLRFSPRHIGSSSMIRAITPGFWFLGSIDVSLLLCLGLVCHRQKSYLFNNESMPNCQIRASALIPIRTGKQLRTNQSVLSR